ncbi:apoptosis-associated speck-like protein containing a CARD [Mugil cephalus]|uniref:apoptosis-associated speck-like protein containing a CARD n=1 Tax=Mugil cephalus TaxID=48193 RepID=UPI001FB59777|nr:apoptosis-associated speck-like protein containing a CARD [Mugil cephalus]
MPPKSIKAALLDALEDLSQDNFKKFVEKLLDRRDEPRVKRSKVEGKDRIDVTNVLVSTFTEAGALPVTVDILKIIDCADIAESLAKETSGQSSTPPASSSSASAGAAGGNTMAEDNHFVNKHQLELIRRVSNIEPILDELLVEGVIQEDAYDTIRSKPTTQEKMRALYRGPLKAGVRSKDVFYGILLKQEKYLVDDLSKSQ